jgi:alpha-tubulin suppressor-like RCC1 family protein
VRAILTSPRFTSTILSCCSLTSLKAARTFLEITLLHLHSALYVWGTNSRGQLGTGKGPDTVWEPVLLDNIPGPVQSLAAGDNHCACVTKDGSIYTWGHGEFGQLGHGNSNSCETPTLLAFTPPKDGKP